jgi:CRISPR-associated exonuclease Cas4
MLYSEDDMLMLSGIQHIAFCPRQWALIHLEQQWDDNKLTAEGKIQHEHVDDPFYRQKIGNVITLRKVSIASKTLGLYGFADIVELYASDTATNAIRHPQYDGFWKPYPIEYKHGKEKSDECDKVQLTAQVICLEEQYGIHIENGALFYAKTKHREVVSINEKLRDQTRYYAKLMHEIFSRGALPKAKKESYCKNCSLIDICMPKIADKGSVSAYLKTNLYEETTKHSIRHDA